MGNTMRSRVAWFAVLLLTGGLWLRVGLLYVDNAAADTSPLLHRTHILVDAGHGGEDGGTAGADGTQEKDINLAVSLPLRDLLRLFGYRVSMTRETDRAIYDEQDASLHGKKVSDMRNRLALYEQADMVLSIHQNYFGQSKYSGTQVFYSTNAAGSQGLAAQLQTAVREQLQPENKREIKAAGEEIYLLHNTTRVAVLVECGFLSNAAECAKLKTDEYRKQLALVLAVGVTEWE